MTLRPEAIHDAIFVDTSGWAEPVLRNSPNAEAMVQFAQSLFASKRTLITTDDVLNELVALLTSRSHSLARPALIQFFNRIRAMPQVFIVHVDETIWAESWALIERMNDKEWSLVDASSFVVMRRFGVYEAFTSDHHYTQAGFSRLPV